MKKLTLIILITFLGSIGLFACKDKDQQSCSDGVFTPDKEQELDCGGVCPPCEDPNPPVQSFVLAKINSISLSFPQKTLVKNPDYILYFSNDSINISLNFGDGDTLGNRPIQNSGSTATFNNQAHSNLASGVVLFSEIDQANKRLSGLFEARFVSDANPNDTLVIKNGDFEKVQWE